MNGKERRVHQFVTIRSSYRQPLEKIATKSPTAKRVFSLEEAAEYCGLSRHSFEKKVIRDRLRKVRVDKCWRFDKADLDTWIDSHKEQILEETAA